MKKLFIKRYAVLLVGMLCVSMLGGCAETQDGSMHTTDTDIETDKEIDKEIDKETETVSDEAPQKDASVTSLGEFSLDDLNGNAYTNEMLKDYKLTMVNVFTTWCTPCINEIPDLEKLHQEMKEQGVSIVGVVLDAIDDEGKVDEQTVEKARLLAERTGVTYPFLIPDAGALNGRLNGIDAIPETFFVDQDGNIVGTEYVGSHDLKEWRTIVETQLVSLAGDPS